VPEVSLLAARRAAELEPENSRCTRILAYVELQAGDPDAAVAHFRQGFDGEHVASVTGLALALLTRGNESDLTEACGLLEGFDLWTGSAYMGALVDALKKASSSDPAVQARIEALRTHATEQIRASELNATAWGLATTDPRDPRKALQMAEEAVALTHRKEANILDTLAKAYAENGQLEDAVRTQREVLALPNPSRTPLMSDADWRSGFEQRLREYEAALAAQKPDAGPE
jgi:Flp pilus assembly protein TadD